jgi:hypothetical protein
VALVAPLAIVTVDGTDSAVLLLVNTTLDAAGLGVLSLTEQLPEPPGVTVKGVQASEDNEPGINNEIGTDLGVPFSVAVTLAVRLDEKVPAWAVNATEDEPPGTVRAELGTVRAVWSLDTEIEAVAAAGTGFVRFTAQGVDVCGARAVAVHVMEDIATGAISARAAVLEPLRVAVTLALWSEANWPAVAVNVPPVDPAPMAREVDVTLMLPVVARVTFAPPDPAGPLNVTVQVDVVPELKEAGLHPRVVMVTGGGVKVTVPPVAVTAMALPLAAAASAPLTPILMLDEPETVAETVAATPLEMVFALRPAAMQV